MRRWRLLGAAGLVLGLVVLAAVLVWRPAPGIPSVPATRAVATTTPTPTADPLVDVSVPRLASGLVPDPGQVGFLGDESTLRLVDSPANAPAGTRWEDGGLVVEADDVVLEGVKVAGGVSFESGGTLTVRGSVIEAVSGWRVLYGGSDVACHLDVSDSTLRFVGTPDNGSAAIHGGCTLTAVRNDISGSGDGIQNGPGRCRVEQNYIHDLAAVSDFHNDGVQLYSGPKIVIRHNRIDIGWNGTNQNGALFFQGTFDAPVIEGNVLSGGGFTLRIEGGPHRAVVRDNVLLAAPGAFGPVLVEPGTVATWEGNVDGSGRALSY